MKEPALKPEGIIHVHLLVSDMKQSIDFYTTVLGFFYDHGIREMAWLRRGKLLLTLSPGEPVGYDKGYFGWALDSFPALEEYYDRLHKRHQRLSGPPDLNAGRGYFFIYDPDDYAISFSFTPFDYPDKGS